MSCTTSPGIIRGSEKTMNDAIRSDGIATSSRRRRYFRTSYLSSQAATTRPPMSCPMLGPKFFTLASHAATALTEGP